MTKTIGAFLLLFSAIALADTFQTNNPVNIEDGAGIPITSTDLGGGHRGLDINTSLTFSGTIGTVAEGAASSNAAGWWVRPGDGTNVQLYTASGEAKVIAASLPLPAGAATSANQSTQIGSLASIVTNTGRIPAQGAATIANSTPVNIASDQVVPVSLSSVPLAAGAATAANQATSNASLASIVTNTGRIPAQGAATIANSTPVNIASDQVVPVSATSLPLPAGAATSANQSTQIGSLASIVTNTGRIPAQGAATIANSTPVNIASDQVVPVSATSLPLPTGASTSANQTTSNTSLSSLDSKLGTLGQKTMAGSAPVVIASDQSVIPVAPVDGLKASYATAAMNLVPVTAATDVMCLQGSNSKTVRVTYVEFSLTKTTAAVIDYQLIKRSSVDTGGSLTTLTNVPQDSNSAAATAVSVFYTANPTLGTALGPIRAWKVLVGTTANPVQIAVWDFGRRPAQAVVLRGNTQQLCLNLNGATLAGQSASGAFEWTEE